MLLDVNRSSRSDGVPIYLPIRSEPKESVVQPHFPQWIGDKDEVVGRVAVAGNPLM